MSQDRELLLKTYQAFNNRDIDAVLAVMHPEVDWPNGMEGGYVHGHAAVRAYWARQWGIIDPYVDPRAFTPDEDGRLIVDVHQVVRDLTSSIISDQMVQHIYRIEAGLIRHMEIRK